MIHPYKLRPYHNPEGVDESKVPEGWRFRYADERLKLPRSDCRIWLPDENRFGDATNCTGRQPFWTYCVPVFYELQDL